MSTNQFYHAVDAQKLEECIAKNENINAFLRNETLKGADTGFSPYYRGLKALIKKDINFKLLGKPMFQANKKLDLDDGGVYSVENVIKVEEALNKVDYAELVNQPISDLDDDEKEELVSYLKDIYAVFQYAKENKLAVVAYTG